jgi:hypothetical protein
VALRASPEAALRPDSPRAKAPAGGAGRAEGESRSRFWGLRLFKYCIAAPIRGAADYLRLAVVRHILARIVGHTPGCSLGLRLTDPSAKIKSCGSEPDDHLKARLMVGFSVCIGYKQLLHFVNSGERSFPHKSGAMACDAIPGRPRFARPSGR